MQANPVCPEKLIALKLYGLNWLDRRWMLSKLEPDLQGKVKQELAQLKAMKVQNPQQLLEQLNESVAAGETEDPQLVGQGKIEDFGFSPALKSQVLALSSDGGQTALALRKAVLQYLTDDGVNR